jgi:hypothetical protein
MSQTPLVTLQPIDHLEVARVILKAAAEPRNRDERVYEVPRDTVAASVGVTIQNA